MTAKVISPVPPPQVLRHFDPRRQSVIQQVWRYLQVDQGCNMYAWSITVQATIGNVEQSCVAKQWWKNSLLRHAQKRTTLMIAQYSLCAKECSIEEMDVIANHVNVLRRMLL